MKQICVVCALPSVRGIIFGTIRPYGVPFNKETRKRLSWLYHSNGEKTVQAEGYFAKEFMCERCFQNPSLWAPCKILTDMKGQTTLETFQSFLG